MLQPTRVDSRYCTQVRTRARTSQACYQLVHSWMSRKFLMGVAILLPMTITFYVVSRLCSCVLRLHAWLTL